MSALTRILNNQIYNSTIIAYQKIAAGTITGSLFASNVTVPGDLLIAGNLFVLGSSAYTTIASTNTYVNDPLVVLNNGFSGTNTRDEGLVFNRGTDQNQAFVWSETGKEFRFIGTTETGTTYGSVVASTFANVHVGNIGVDYNIRTNTLTVNTAITSSSLNLSGNLLASTVLASFVTASTSTFGNVAAVTVGNVGTQFNGAAINLSGNVLATAGIFNALTVNGNESVTGFLNVTGNILGAGAILNSLTVNGNESVTGFLNVTGNILATTVDVGGIESTGVIYANSTLISTTTTSGALQVAGGVGIAGNLNIGTAGAVSGQFHTVRGNISQTSSGGIVYFNTSGNVMAAIGQFGAINTSGNISTAQLNAGQINTTGNVLATAGVFNALTVNGNESVTGFLNVTGNVMAAVITASQINTSGNVLATAGTFNALTVNGNETISGFINAAGNIGTPQLNAGQINTTGNLIASTVIANFLTADDVVFGNVSAALFGNVGAVYTGASINLSGNVLATGGVFNALTVNGNETVTGFLNVTGNVLASQGTLNYLDVNGNVDLGLTGAISGSWVNVIGNITQTSAGGPVYFNTTGNISAASASFGTISLTGFINTSGNISGAQINAGQINTTGNVLATAGVFNSLTVNGNETVTGFLNVTGNILGATGTLSILGVSNNLWANASIATTTQGTGAIVVPNGGISVAGAANIAGSITTAGAAQFNNTIAVGGISTFTNSTNATTTNNGAVIIQGGASVAKDLWVGGNLYAANIIGVTANVITVQDQLLFLKPSYTFPYNYDIGFYSAFTGTGLTTAGNVLQHTAVIRNDSDNTWTFASNLAEPGAGHVVFGVNTVYDPIKAGNLTLVNTTAATTTGTGALIVGGGAGIGGAVVAAQLNSTGNVLGQAGTFNALTVNGNESVTGFLNVTGNILGAVGTLSGLTVNGNESVTGFLNVTGNVMAAVITASQLNTTGNVLATAGVFNALTVNGNETVTGFLNVTGNIIATTVDTEGIEATGVVLANSTLISTTTTSGALQVVGGVGIGGNLNIGTIGAVSGQFHTIRGNITQSTSGGAVYFNTAGNIMAAIGQFGAINTSGNISTAQLNAGQINTTGNVLATAGVFNALTVNGNESVTGFLNVTGNVMAAVVTASQINTSGNVLATAGVFNGLTVNGNESVTGFLNVTGNILGATGTLSGLTVNGNESVTGFLNVTGNVMAAVVTASQINTTGNVLGQAGVFNGLTVNGNESVTGFLNVTGNVMAAVVTASQINTSGNVLATAGTFNALTVNGNESVTGFLNVTGNVLATRVDTNVLAATGVIWANASTDSTTVGIGAIVAPNGGISANGNINITAGKQLVVGQNLVGEAYLPNATAHFFSNIDSYSQVNQQNISTGTSSSSDFIATSSNGNDTNNFIDMGINGLNYNQSAFGITKANDGYLYVQGNTAASGGNLAIGVGTADRYIVMFQGSSEATAEVARFSGNVGTTGNAWLKYTTVATTPNTGALRVDGGVGIGGNIRVAGGAVFNNSQTADPFQVKGVATTSLIYADTAIGAVVLGGSNVAPQLGSTVKINGTDSMLLPIGTTGQRPGASGNLDVRGMIRFNTTINNMEFYDGTQWQTAGSVFTIISDRQFAGNVGGAYGNVDGTNTTFTIQANSTTSATLVSINGVMQFPVLAYEVTNSTLTFTEPPAPTDVIDVRVLATTSTIGALGSGSGLNQVIAANDGVQIWTGTTATIERILVNQAGDVNLLDNNKITYTQGAVNIAANNTPYVIATYSQTAYTTAKFLVSAKKGATNFQSMESIVTTDGAGNAYMTTYAVVSNGIDMGGLTANVVGGNVQVYFTTTTNVTNANVKAMGTYIV
jgi:hypothetical protein